MTFSSLLNTLQNNLLLTLAILLVIIIGLAVMIWRVKQQSEEEQNSLKRRQETLWQELDDIRVGGPVPSGASPAVAAGAGAPLEREQFAVEKSVYEEIWPLIWSLHDRVGGFLRTVDADESTDESRLAARNAALDTRGAMNRLRPFYSDQLDDLLVQFVDTEIQVHLAACQYLDNHAGRDDTLKKSDKDYEAYRSKSRQLYDEEARSLLNQIMTVMRRRMVRPIEE